MTTPTVSEAERARLHAALAPLIEAKGRVQLYEPSKVTAPGMYIGMERRDLVTLVGNVQGARLTFPVTVYADGSDLAQQRTLTRLVDAVWDACEAMPLCGVVRATPGRINPADPTGPLPADGGIRSVTLDVEIVVRTRTFCPVPVPDTPAWPASVPA